MNFDQILTSLPVPNSKNSYHDLGIDYFDELTKLHLILVKKGIKKLFFEYSHRRGIPDENNDQYSKYEYQEHEQEKVVIQNLLTAVSKLGLKSIEINSGPMVFHKSEYLDQKITNKVSETLGGGKELWVYNNDDMLELIQNKKTNPLNNGILLGYPTCCVEWMIKMKTRYLIDVYSCYWNKIGIDKDEEILEFIKTYYESPQIPNFYENMYEIKKEHLAKTIKKFPFVFHQACDECLIDEKEDQSLSYLLNKKYENVAKQISKNFHQKVKEESKKTYNYIMSNLPDPKNDAKYNR